MDKDLSKIISQIQTITKLEHNKYKHEMIDGRQAINCMETTTDSEPKRSWEYDRLMRQQRRLIYRKDAVAQQKAEAKIAEIEDHEMTTKCVESKVEKLPLKPYEAEQSLDNQELQRHWHKLSNNQKIQAIIQFIDTISDYLKDEQITKLRYLLISAVSQREITRKTDVDYDIDKGIIRKIYKLKYDNNDFILLDKGDESSSVGLSTFIPDESEESKDNKISIISPKLVNQPTVRKKIILLKKI